MNGQMFYPMIFGVYTHNSCRNSRVVTGIYFHSEGQGSSPGLTNIKNYRILFFELQSPLGRESQSFRVYFWHAT